MTSNKWPRWMNYYFRRGEDFKDWKDYLQCETRNMLFIVGLGFDPRMCRSLEEIASMGGSGTRDCLIIKFDSGANFQNGRYSSLIEQNMRKLDSLFPTGKKNTRQIPMWSADNSRIGSQNAANVFTNLTELAPYSDIAVDVSAMPRGLYFPLIGKLLYLLDAAYKQEKTNLPNLHVLVSENAQLDSKITDQGIDDDASYLYGFTGTLGTESSAGSPRIWIPILGEGQTEQIKRIYDLVLPDEICPVLPIPSSNPRRLDNLIVEYRAILFDRLRVDPNNFIYVDEQNPFEVYSKLYQTIVHYNSALKTLGGCQVIISALSSKLLSIGALLTAYELKNYGQGVGISHVETRGYNFKEGQGIENILSETILSTLWLAGDCYEH
jgi:hypothetical protein